MYHMESWISESDILERFLLLNSLSTFFHDPNTMYLKALPLLAYSGVATQVSPFGPSQVYLRYAGLQQTLTIPNRFYAIGWNRKWLAIVNHEGCCFTFKSKLRCNIYKRSP